MAVSKKNVVEYRLYDLPLALPALLLTGEKWRISDELSNRLHFHNCVELGFCHSGRGTLVFNSQRIPFQAGDITIIPRHVPHTTCSEKGTKSHWSYLFVDLAGLAGRLVPVESLLDVSSQDWMPHTYLYSSTDAPRLHFLANCLLDEFSSTRQDWVEVVKSLAMVMFYELQRLNNTPGAHKTEQHKSSFALRPALEHIHHNYMNHIKMKELADLCHLSETHFRRMFLSVMGTTPLNFINARRINQACVLLDTTDLPVADIIEAVGISSTSSFNRNFHQMIGVSPREYRNSASKANISPKHKYILTYKGWLSPEERPEFIAEELD